MTEQDALIQLGAEDWHSLNKNQIMSFLFEMAPKLSDEVRLRILETAPDILNTAKTTLSEYQDMAKKALAQNHEVANKVLDQNHDIAGAMFTSLREVIETLRDLLANPTASFEEKQYWNGELRKYLQEMREYDRENKIFINNLDKENKTFIQNTLKVVGIAAIVLVGGAIALLAGGGGGGGDS